MIFFTRYLYVELSLAFTLKYGLSGLFNVYAGVFRPDVYLDVVFGLIWTYLDLLTQTTSNYLALALGV